MLFVRTFILLTINTKISQIFDIHNRFKRLLIILMLLGMKTKKIIFAIAMIALVSCQTNNGVENDLNKMQLNGKVKSVSIRSYHIDDSLGEIQKGVPRLSMISDDSNCDIIFDVDGFMLSKKNYYAIGDKNYSSYVEMKRTDRSLEEIIYDTEGEIAGRTIKHLNNKGQIVTEKRYKADGNFFQTTEYYYNENDQLIESKTMSPQEELRSVVLYTYNSDKTLAMETMFLSYEEDWSTFSEYFFYENGRLNKMETAYMNKDGKITIENVKNVDNIDRDKYEYDTHHNWIKQVIIDEEGQACYIMERSILYY